MWSDDPTLGIKALRYETEGFYTWTEDDIAAFYERHPIGTMARLVPARRRRQTWTAEHQERPSHLHPGEESDSQTDDAHDPGSPALRRVIDATPMVGVKPFLVTSFGKPFAPAGSDARAVR